MSITGLCQVCEAATATRTCDRCGRAVCDDHWNETTRACADCAAGRG
jgi:hypothetical protein